MNTKPSPDSRRSADPSAKHHPLCAPVGAVLRERREALGRSAYEVADCARIARAN